MKLAGAILAGGRSSRMGAPKEGVALPDGRTLIEHVAAALRPLVEALVVAGNCRGFDVARIGASRVDDLRSGLGPLAGIEAILRSGTADAYVVAACDQARLTTELFRLLAAGPDDSPAALCPHGGIGLDPFPCFLPASLADAVSDELDQGERSPRAFLIRHGARTIRMPATTTGLIVSLNTPEDVAHEWQLQRNRPSPVRPSGSAT